jgi:hypothetical protein
VPRARLSHGRFGADEDLASEALPLLFGRNRDPIKVVGAVRAGDGAVASVSDEPAATLGEDEMVTRANAIGEPLGDELAGDLHLRPIEESRRSDERLHPPDIVCHHGAAPFEALAAPFPAVYARKRRRHLSRRGMAGDQPGEEVADIRAERAHAIAALLHDEGRVTLLADHVPEPLEVAGAIRPGAGRVAAGRVEARADDEVGRAETANAAQGLAKGSAVLLRRDVLRQRKVEIVSGTGADPRLVTKAREIGISEARMSVNGDGQNIRARVEDLLLAVAVVIVDVEDGDAAVAGEHVGGNRGT